MLCCCEVTHLFNEGIHSAGNCGNLIKYTAFLLTRHISTLGANVCNENGGDVCVQGSVERWMEVKRGEQGGETPPGLTVLRVLHLADAAVGRGPLVVVLRQSQGPDPRPRRRLGAGRL